MIKYNLETTKSDNASANPNKSANLHLAQPEAPPRRPTDLAEKEPSSSEQENQCTPRSWPPARSASPGGGEPQQPDTNHPTSPSHLEPKSPLDTADAPEYLHAPAHSQAARKSDAPDIEQRHRTLPEADSRAQSSLRPDFPPPSSLPVHSPPLTPTHTTSPGIEPVPSPASVAPSSPPSRRPAWRSAPEAPAHPQFDNDPDDIQDVIARFAQMQDRHIQALQATASAFFVAHATLEGHQALMRQVTANQEALKRQQDSLARQLENLGRSLLNP